MSDANNRADMIAGGIPERRCGFWRRCYAMMVKEFIQLRRDRVSFAMIVMIPVLQLLLFGYAINTTPRNLPTAVLLQEDSDLALSVLKALQNTAYFHFTREVHDVTEFDDLLLSGKVLFGVEITRGFEPFNRTARAAEKIDAIRQADRSVMESIDRAGEAPAIAGAADFLAGGAKISADGRE